MTEIIQYVSIFIMKTPKKLQDKVIIANPNDNVATARAEIDAGIVLSRDEGDDITTREKIPFGHKIALKGIIEGKPVFKYGQRIGVAMSNIKPGDLVHVHNLSGERGRSK